MQRAAVFVTVLTAVFAIATTAMAENMGREAVETDPQDRDIAEPLAIQARILEIGTGWLEVDTVDVQQGADMQPCTRLLVRETAATQFLPTRGAVTVLDLKVGEVIQIVGTIRRMVYQADSITLIQ